jgi:hypothetical protein
MALLVAATAVAAEPSVAASPEAAIGLCDEAMVVTPDPTLVDPQPAAWERVVVGPDGRSLSVYFWMGMPGCAGLQSVDVSETDIGATVQLMIGSPPDAETQSCRLSAGLYRTQVVLEDPVLLGGGTP